MGGRGFFPLSPDIFISEQSSVVGGGAADDSAAIQSLINSAAAAGKRLVFNRKQSYKIGGLYLPSNLRMAFNPSVSFTKKLNAAGAFTLQDISNTVIEGNGAQVNGTDFPGSTVYTHTVAVNGTLNCSVLDLHVSGASTGNGGMDCLYLGKGSAGPNLGTTIRGGSYNYSQRNGISVVSAKGFLIEDLECAHNVGAPGYGIDIEANFYDNVDGGLIRRVNAHHNQNSGIGNTFGTNVVVDDCDLHDNGGHGWGVSSGGGQILADNAYRPNVDMIGITGFDMATGTVLVAAQPPIGTVVGFSLKNGATRPPELSSVYYVVSRHIGTTGVILGLSEGHSEVTSFSTAGTGTMTSSPATSDVRLTAFTFDQAGGAVFRNSRAYNNGGNGAIVTGSGYALIEDCEIYDNAGVNVEIKYTRDVTVRRTPIHGGSSMGLRASIGGGALLIEDCPVTDTPSRGVVIEEWTGAVLAGGGADNCGASDPYVGGRSGVYLSGVKDPTVTGMTITQDAGNTATTYGLLAEGTTTGGTFTDNDLTGAGTTNANSLVVPAGSTKARNKRRDGVLVP